MAFGLDQGARVQWHLGELKGRRADRGLFAGLAKKGGRGSLWRAPCGERCQRAQDGSSARFSSFDRAAAGGHSGAIIDKKSDPTTEPGCRFISLSREAHSSVFSGVFTAFGMPSGVGATVCRLAPTKQRFRALLRAAARVSTACRASSPSLNRAPFSPGMFL